MSSIDDFVLEQFYHIINPSKQEMFNRIAADRTRYLTVVLENVQKDHNASAVLRSCDCFGIQDLHTIEKGTDYAIRREIAKGAGNWVDIHSHSTGDYPELECIQELKSKGYKIVSTSPHTEKTIFDIELDQPLALVFGTERKGISEIIRKESDDLVRIPMYGFSESFNVSVSVAIMLNTLRERLNNVDFQWKLTPTQQTQLKIDWCTKIVNEGVAVEQEIRRRILEKD
jgi:tRNA (guanosine-2'-O-)-methyltransferase